MLSEKTETNGGGAAKEGESGCGRDAADLCTSQQALHAVQCSAEADGGGLHRPTGGGGGGDVGLGEDVGVGEGEMLILHSEAQQKQYHYCDNVFCQHLENQRALLSNPNSQNLLRTPEEVSCLMSSLLQQCARGHTV